MLLIPHQRLDDRRRVTRDGELGALYDSLAAELEPIVGREPYIPDAKALLSRAGGRCEKDGSVLEFDPTSPHEHRCPRCGVTYRGAVHHRAWVMPYQLWLAERAVHSALFYALRGDQRHAKLARAILAGYADRYLRYPNVDNVLGPTRPFFSTYLESIWLLQVCLATGLLEVAGDTALRGQVIDRIVEPSRRLIAEFDEGMSNRQVWNNAALIAAATLVGDMAAIDERVNAHTSGVSAHLTHAMLRDATWYEGENYHQFALRGLWYAVTLAETQGLTIPAPLGDRFERAFEVLYLTALPDFTMPSRKDSQYAVSLRQWRLAELAELGFARRQSAVLAGALARTYAAPASRGDTGRSRSTADAERNGPATALTRADLGWRALLHAVPGLPSVEPRAPQSVHLEAQGLAVFRRSPSVYLSLDYGRYGGGHGHPDRLNLNLSVADARVLDDLGTGSYVDKTLHWYRSTLAHNAPLVNGMSQPGQDGVLVAHDERGALGWTVASLDCAEPTVRIERTIVVAPEYAVDELRWTADHDVRVELPWHLAGEVNVELSPAALDGGDGLEDGFGFVEDAARATLAADAVTEVRGSAVRAWLTSDQPAELFRATGPGQPATTSRRFYLLRSTGRTGRFRAVIAWAEVGAPAFANDGLTLQSGEGTRYLHRRDENGWHVELHAEGARSSVDLAGFSRSAPVPVVAPPKSSAPLHLRGEMTFELGERHYRRSEVSWRDAGSPRATLVIARALGGLNVTVNVRAEQQRFAQPDAMNPYDNEHADTMGAGVQLYLTTDAGRGAWVLAPDAGGRVRTRAITGWTDLHEAPTAQWTRSDQGYSVACRVPVAPGKRFGLDVLINDAVPGRERRRGQLVLSGAQGEFVYLRGDRHDEERLLAFILES